MNAEKRTFDAEVAKIAKQLGWEFERTESYWYCRVVGEDGKALHVSMAQGGADGERMEISGSWPTDNSRYTYTPPVNKRISVSRKRTAEAIAADIQRRFLPWYEAAFAIQAKRAADNDDCQRRREELAPELQKLMGAKSYKSHNDPTEIHAHGLTVKVGSEDMIHIDVRHAGMKTAKAVLRAYAKAGGLDDGIVDE